MCDFYDLLKRSIDLASHGNQTHRERIDTWMKKKKKY